MKHLLITTIAAVVLVGCGESQSPEPPTVEAADISIYEAAEDGNIQAVKQHLAAGTDVNAKTDTGWIPLHRAAYWGHKEVAELLIANGAEVNTKNENGWTPLHYAAVVDHKEIVELLLASGADVNAKTDAGETPLDNAIKYKRTKTADLLRKHGGKMGNWLNADDFIHSAASAGHIEAVKQNLANGVDVNAIDDEDLTPLDTAIRRKHSETADLLRKHGGKTGEELKAEGK